MFNLIYFVFHLIGAGNFAFAIYYDVNVLKFPEDFNKSVVEFGGRWKYLTFWNMVMQLVYFSLCIVNDLIGTSSLNKRERAFLQQLRDGFFGSLAFPLSLFVGLTFWGLWAVDRELVFPAALDVFFPSWLNHMMHSTIIPLAFLELYIIPRIYPLKSKALLGLAALMLGYLLWVFYIAFRTEFWVYPILAVLDWSYRLLFIAILMVVISILYFIGEKLHWVFWGKQLHKIANKDKDVIKPPKKTTFAAKDGVSQKKSAKGTKENLQVKRRNK